jgi:hypothetical protein
MSKVRKPGRRTKRDSAPCLYLGCFFFDEPGERERTGSFQIVVEATEPLEAVDKCRDRLRWLRTSTTLFDEPVTIYIEGIIKLSGTFAKGLLVNFESGDSPPTPQVELTCLIPEQTDHGAFDYGWKPPRSGRKSKEDKDTIEPFLDFGGQRFRLALRKAQGTEAARPPTGSLPSSARASPSEAERAAKVAAAEAARNEAAAKKKRREALRSTLDELRSTNLARRSSAD